MFKNVIKRDGRRRKFNPSKIILAIKNTLVETKEKDPKDELLDHLEERVEEELEKKGYKVPSVEQIQDEVERVLMLHGLTSTAKAFIVYRTTRDKAREEANFLLDYRNLMDSYLKQNDWRVKENSTVTYSLGGLILGNSQFFLIVQRLQMRHLRHFE